MNRREWLLFGALSVIWGVPYFFIKVALHDLSPAWIAFARVALGAVVLGLVVPPRDWIALRLKIAAIVAVAVTDIALPFYLIARGEKCVSSALTGLLLAAIPLVTAFLALVLDRRDRLTRSQLGGLTAGFAGVAVLLGFNVGHDREALVGAALISGATLCYSVGVLLIKRLLHDTPIRATNAAMLIAAALLLAPTALAQWPSHAPSIAVCISIAILGVLCTAAAYLMYFALIAGVGPTRASVVTYVNPAVAAVLGVAVLHEPLSATAALGLAFVVAGSWLSTGGRRRDPVTTAEQHL